MPRCARKKSPESIYHIMCRSNSEILLFRNDDDKDYYLGLLSRYIKKYKCNVYAYCLMDTHFHMHFDPRGGDVSQFMHSINTAYVRYYNKKYERHGHLFEERFQSEIVNSEAYHLALSAYIHNNPHDIEEYNGKEEKYKYSSYGIYIGLRKDNYKLIDKSLMYNIFNATEKNFVEKYIAFVSQYREVECLRELVEDLEIEYKNEYRSERNVIKRDAQPSVVISYITEKIINIKQKRQKFIYKKKEFRYFCAYVLRVLCGLKFRQICTHIYNITLSGCSIMCDRGYRLSVEKEEYKEIFDELIQMKILI